MIRRKCTPSCTGLGSGAHSVAELSCENTWMAMDEGGRGDPIGAAGAVGAGDDAGDVRAVARTPRRHTRRRPRSLEFTPPGHTDDVNGSPRPRALE